MIASRSRNAGVHKDPQTTAKEDARRGWKEIERRYNKWAKHNGRAERPPKALENKYKQYLRQKNPPAVHHARPEVNGRCLYPCTALPFVRTPLPMFLVSEPSGHPPIVPTLYLGLQRFYAMKDY
ncbi:hypothetical protein B0H12DRAFT_1247024 [Mycena haematopus]|nr:hypothetical protein B0H12DRAFT_1247024 [Mycena haematopus]